MPNSRRRQDESNVRNETLGQAARDDIRAKAKARALLKMTEVEWEAHRIATGDPVRADVLMAFGEDSTENQE